MKLIPILIPFIFSIFSTACSSDAPLDCAEVSIEDCESKGCALQTGNPYSQDDHCLEAATAYGCGVQQDCDDALTIGHKDQKCALFSTTCLPEGWSTPGPNECEDFMVEAELCENAPKCEDLTIAECLSPRCSIIQGQRYVVGANSAECLEAPEALGCHSANTVCDDAMGSSMHEGDCYVFPSQCLPPGWELGGDCANTSADMCD